MFHLPSGIMPRERLTRVVAALVWLAAAYAVCLPATVGVFVPASPPDPTERPDLDRTPAGDVWTPVYEGIDLARWTVDVPLYRVYAARIDLHNPRLRHVAAARNPRYLEGKRETRRQTTPAFLEENGLSFAINTNYYLPFNFWTVRFTGDADLGGLAVAEGEVVSPPQEGFVSALFYNDGRDPEIRRLLPGDDVSDVWFAFSGRRRTLTDGVPCKASASSARQPRSAVGFSRDRRYLYFLVIDGRQPGYSVGATLPEEGRELLRCGAYDGFNLDGGGSSTMVIRGADGRGVVVNRPCNATWGRLRHNGNAFGIAAPGGLLAPVADGRRRPDRGRRSAEPGKK